MGNVSISAGMHGRTRWVAGLMVAVVLHAAILAFALQRGASTPPTAAKSSEFAASVADAPAVSTEPVEVDNASQFTPQITLNFAAPVKALPKQLPGLGTASLQRHRLAPVITKTSVGTPTTPTEAAKLRHHSPAKSKGSKAHRQPRALHPHKRSRSPGHSAPAHAISHSLPDAPAPIGGADDRVLI